MYINSKSLVSVSFKKLFILFNKIVFVSKCSKSNKSFIETFNECASAISGQLEKISSQVQDVCGAFIVEVNDADSYLF